MRALCLVLIAACSSPPPPQAAKPAPAPAQAPVDDGPSWVGVRVDSQAPVRITQIIKDAPGDKAGLKIGDEIALGSERRGPIQAHEAGLPSYRGEAEATD